MILVDANLLLYARDSTETRHAAAAEWLTQQLNGSAPVGLPWQSLTAFVRIATHPRVYDAPLTAEEAWRQMESWTSAGPAFVPQPTSGYGRVLGELVRRHGVTGNLVSDAALAALALEHGLTVCSADSDFARFPEIRWQNPVAESSGS